MVSRIKYLLPADVQAGTKEQIGGKARNLCRLWSMGMNVPKFIVLPQDILAAAMPGGISQPAVDDIIGCFPGIKFFAVRSSAMDEDGTQFSFAGQYESYLYVLPQQLAEKIKNVWDSAFSERVAVYRRNNNLSAENGIAVIVQEMIEADVAGVAFGTNPVTGKDEHVISAVYGLGEGLVSGELDADNFIIVDSKIDSHIAEKKYKIIGKDGGGIIKVKVDAHLIGKPSINSKQVGAISSLLSELQTEYGGPQDIEFAYVGEHLYLLQARPVTSVVKDKNVGDYILWDNSNIIESYPGVTTPLTFSFISKSYEGAYKLFCKYLGVSNKTIVESERVFANTLGFINGRVYYNLKSWYHMLAMLPGYSINARFMEQMMGVKERFDIPENFQLSKGKAWLRIGKMAAQMYVRFLSLPVKRKEFMALLDSTIQQYKSINLADKNANELMQLYLNFERKLLNEWKAPLLNDFFAMIWFGLLQKRCSNYAFSKNINIHNDLLCGSNDIVSVQPIHRTIAISGKILAKTALRELFENTGEQEIWRLLNNTTDKELTGIKNDIDKYIADFGERCIGELKLETISYTQEPAKFVKVVKSYVLAGMTAETTAGRVEEELRATAEKELEEGLKSSPLKKWLLKRTVKKARELVSARENLRYERTRAFGIVRELFRHIGAVFFRKNIIAAEHDIFYLTKDEIFSFIEGTAVTQDIAGLIRFRKQEYSKYLHNAPGERFATYGIVYNDNDLNPIDNNEVKAQLKGIGCCPGKVRAKVRVIADPGEVSSLNGDILVTTSTDPGWVTLFVGAAGIIVERGSLLSHSAIVAREMGKPCIVGVTGLLKTIKTGDEIEMDGSTGIINIILPFASPLPAASAAEI